jgi:hypothetical protein
MLGSKSQRKFALLNQLIDTGHKVGAFNFHPVLVIIIDAIFMGPVLCDPRRKHAQDISVHLTPVFEILSLYSVNVLIAHIDRVKAYQIFQAI